MFYERPRNHRRSPFQYREILRPTNAPPRTGAATRTPRLGGVFVPPPPPLAPAAVLALGLGHRREKRRRRVSLFRASKHLRERRSVRGARRSPATARRRRPPPPPPPPAAVPRRARRTFAAGSGAGGGASVFTSGELVVAPRMRPRGLSRPNTRLAIAASVADRADAGVFHPSIGAAPVANDTCVGLSPRAFLRARLLASGPVLGPVLDPASTPRASRRSRHRHPRRDDDDGARRRRAGRGVSAARDRRGARRPVEGGRAPRQSPPRFSRPPRVAVRRRRRAYTPAIPARPS